jgi:mRNA interferase HigB
MRIITKKRIQTYAENHPNATPSLNAWTAVAERSKWESLVNLRQTFPHADQVTAKSNRTVTIFNIAGNHHRLITAIHYNTGIIYILNILTHAEYSKNKWQQEL